VTSDDADGDPLQFSATGLPAGLAIEPFSGEIRGTIADDAAESNGGNYTVTVTATDPTGASGSQQFQWTITDTNHAPVLSPLGDQGNAEGDAVTLETRASDPDG